MGLVHRLLVFSLLLQLIQILLRNRDSFEVIVQGALISFDSQKVISALFLIRLAIAVCVPMASDVTISVQIEISPLLCHCCNLVEFFVHRCLPQTYTVLRIHALSTCTAFFPLPALPRIVLPSILKSLCPCRVAGVSSGTSMRLHHS